MGPGMALKSVAGDRFSLIAFGAAQVIIDIEPGIGMLRGSDTLHGWSHTYAGATVIAAMVVASRPLWNRVLQWWNAELRYHKLDWLASPQPIGWFAVATGAFIGTYSHIALDSIMHVDIRPYAPFSNGNSLLDLISTPSLYAGCVAAGIAGLMVWIGVRWRRRLQQGEQP